MAYAGRFVQQMETRNFGGINANATLVNIGENQAQDITNWDIGRDGAIVRRKGFTLLSSPGRAVNPLAVFYYPFQDSAGTFRHAVVAYNNSDQLSLFEAASPSGPWTERGTNLFTVTDPSRYIGVSWRGALYIFNGTDAPVRHVYGQSSSTLENASKLLDPASLTVARTGAFSVPGGTYGYGVAAITPRGKTKTAVDDTKGSNNSNLTTADFVAGSNFYTLAWSPVADASGYEIYVRYDNTAAAATRLSGLSPAPPTGSWVRIAQVDSQTTSYVDNGASVSGSPVYCNTVNNAFNTPNDWNVNGPPKGAIVIAKGQDERMLAWRGSDIWCSTLSDGLNWLVNGDAFSFPVTGGTNTQIKAAAALYDYFILWTTTDSYVYSGASGATIQLEKIIPVGCAAHNSVVRVGPDIYLWSQYGPTTFQRILSGADIQAASRFNENIYPIIRDQISRTQWGRIHGYNDIANNRVVWCVPGSGSSVNTIAIVYQYDAGGFTKYDNWAFTHAYALPDTFAIYGIKDNTTTSSVFQLATTNQDNGTNITATYKTGFFDWRTWAPRKRLVWCDVLASRADGNYSFSLSWNYDYGRVVSSAISCTQTTTDGSTIQTTSSDVTHHRIYTTGIGNAVQLVFTASGGNEVVKLIGWRPDAREKGLRV